MSAEGFFITNPKDNNVDLTITFEGYGGVRKKFKTLKPGESCRVDKKAVQVEEEVRPPRLELLKDGRFIPDKKKLPASLMLRR